MPISQIASNQWLLETDSTSYAIGLNTAGQLVNSYWGKRLPAPTDYPAPLDGFPWASFTGAPHLAREEYPVYGGYKFTEPCLIALLPDGVRTLELQFDSAAIVDNSALDLHFVDSFYPLWVTLHYRVHAAYDLVERSATITNMGTEAIQLERIMSATWHLPIGDEYRLTHLTGRWLDETHIRREPLVQGVKVLESRRLTTSHHHNPWFAVDRGGADETQGEIWFGALAWSGNWKITAEVTDFASTRIGIGLNDWDFEWRLNGGDSFDTPATVAGYTDAGFGSASRRLHDYVRETILPHGQTIHKILYNSWEATFFNVDEASQARIAELAAQMGIELFVMDDGWFNDRNNDDAGLGDWWPDAVKFPNGLKSLVDRVNALGMDFGLWVEPEMVNPNSDLYRAHPDWVLHFPNRTRTEARQQLILNLARADVQDYLFEKLDKLLTENNIAFIKWDMNRNVSEPGWPSAEGNPREVWVRYVEGVYRLWGKLREQHPNVIWQSCSGGGGRADLGILHLADQIWVSDNTEATARLAIQEGFSQVFPANTMEAWVTDAGRDHVPLRFRFHVSMCGSLGVGGNLIEWSERERTDAADLIADYKAVRHIIQLGDQYRLRSAQASAFSAVQYVSKDKSEGVLFAFRTHIPEPVILPLIYPRGLDPEARYRIDGFTETRSGAGWMHAGVQIDLRDFGSTMRRIRHAT